MQTQPERSPQDDKMSPALRSDIILISSLLLLFAVVYIFPSFGLYTPNTPAGFMLGVINFVIIYPLMGIILIAGLLYRKSRLIIFLKYLLAGIQCLTIVLFFLFNTYTLPKETGWNNGIPRKSRMYVFPA